MEAELERRKAVWARDYQFQTIPTYECSKHTLYLNFTYYLLQRDANINKFLRILQVEQFTSCTMTDWGGGEGGWSPCQRDCAGS